MKYFLSIVALSFFLTACHQISGSGNIISQERNTGAFKAIRVSAGIEVEIRNGSKEQVTVEADDNLIDEVETVVKNGQLRIRFRDNTSVNDAHIKVYVTAPEINDIDASSAAQVTAQETLRSAGQISLNASSSANITAALDAPRVVAEASSAGRLQLSGRTKNVDANASSGASIRAAGLLSENTTAETSSGASVSVYASINLVANASSGGKIDYSGDAKVQRTESSGGSISKGN